MKHSSLLLGTAALLLSGSACTRLEPAPEHSADRSAVLSIRLEDPGATRAGADTYNTKTIADLTVLAFHPDGTLDSGGRTAENSLTLQLTPETGKRIYVLVNSPASTATLSRESDVKALKTSLSAHTSGHFPMAWSGTVSISGNQNLDIEAARLATQVRIDKITNRSGHDLTVRAVYLTNAATDGVPWFSPDSYTPSAWSNKMRYVSSSLDPYLYESVKSGKIADGKALSRTFVFFACPNPTAQDTFAGSWTPRKTRLVIEAEMEGVTYWYPFTLDNLLSNHRYVITNLNITRPGSVHPDIPVDPRDLQVSAVLASWSGDIRYTDPI